MNKMTGAKIIINGGRTAIYLLIAVITIIFLYYYERQFSLAFVVAMMLALIASTAAAFIAATSISAGISFTQNTVNKGEDVHLTLRAESSGWLPIGFLYVKFHNEWLLADTENAQHLISLSNKRSGIITKNYKAEIWGTASLGVSEIAVYDYLGLFKIIFTGNRETLAGKVSIRPTVPESQSNDYLAYICNKMVSDEKEDGQSMKHSFMSQPGYEHRPYIPGDPLKLINWKLSARLDKYMIRENEFLTPPVPVIVLDRCGLRQGASEEWLKDAALLEERIVEAVLAMINSMVRLEIACKVYYYLNNAWQAQTIENINQIMELRQSLSHYVFDNLAAQRIPEDAAAEGSTIAIFTPALDSALQAEIARAEGKNATINIICSEFPSNSIPNAWIVDETYNFHTLTPNS